MRVLRLYVGSVGVMLVVETGIDLSDFDYVGLVVKKPDGSVVEWAGVAKGSRIEYVIQEGDLNVPGSYKIQAVVRNGTFESLGETTMLYVYPEFG